MKKETQKKLFTGLGAVLLGGGFYIGGSFLGAELANPDEEAATGQTGSVPESAIESSESKDTESVAEVQKFTITTKGKTEKDFISGEPKMEQESVIDRDEAPWSDGYVNDDNHLDYLTKQEFAKKLNSGERFVIYVGRATCPYCHEYRSKQDGALENLDANIFSLDTEFYKNDKDVANFRDILGIEYVPTVAVIENGKVVSEMPESEMAVQGTVAQWFRENLEK